jgi:hypothetical protein
MEGVRIWLISQVADFCDTGIQKLIPQDDKCLSSMVTTLRSSLSLYAFFVYTFFFLLLVLLIAHRKLFAE